MNVRAGTRLRSRVSTVEVIVVRGVGDVDLRCGGVPMAAVGEQHEAIDPAVDGATLMGKRYASDAGSVEVMCTKAGTGMLSIGDEPLVEKSSKPLPSSD